MKLYKKNQLLILVIFSMSIIPFLIAWFLSRHPALLTHSTNQGQLIIPPIATSTEDFIGFDSFSAQNSHELSGHWLITNVITKSVCDKTCLDALLKTKQLRLMLNKELARTRRLVLISAADLTDASQLWLKDALLGQIRESEPLLFEQLLAPDQLVPPSLVERIGSEQDPDIALQSDLIRIIPSKALMDKINAIAPDGLDNGMLLLIDPLGNLMMRYDTGFDPYKVKNDLMHLLRVSQIG